MAVGGAAVHLEVVGAEIYGRLKRGERVLRVMEMLAAVGDDGDGEKCGSHFLRERSSSITSSRAFQGSGLATGPVSEKSSRTSSLAL